MAKQPIAHSANEQGEQHDLVKHLTAVAIMARGFASEFGAGELAHLLGLWHDAGKFNPEFQSYLHAMEQIHAMEQKRPHPKVPHAIWGAALAYKLLYEVKHVEEAWKELALPIAGHHAGLADGGEIATKLRKFLGDNPKALSKLAPYMKTLLPQPQLPAMPLPTNRTRRELRLRMVFSALVDADYLDTERHFQTERTQFRGGHTDVSQLWQTLEDNQKSFVAQAKLKGYSRLNEIRDEVYEQCKASALGPPGVYRLTVPTGGGKTRSGLAFALTHAEANNLRRVVVAIPYTSIIDQTAKEYRKIFGEEAVIEHHSQVAHSDGEEMDEFTQRWRLATENWDAPIIVTTTVQLLESLLGRSPSQVRKLHNLARSVILLDEVQTLPTEILEPTLDVLRALVEEYGVTLVLSTATQPALENSPYLRSFHGLPISEIVPSYEEHFERLRRVDYALKPDPLSWEELASAVGDQNQVMVVLNSRRDAIALVSALKEQDEGGVLHLSSLLCTAHRRAILEDVENRLKNGQSTQLVATQVVEAGVDLDFPTVWRAIGPLDRIVQAAGRCNREGKPEKGKVVIFEPAEGTAPKGPYAAGIEEARALLARYGPDRLHDPQIYREYFTKLFGVVDLDKHGIQPLRRSLSYPEVGEKYQLIQKDTVPVVVEYGDALRRLEEWLNKPSRETWRRLQPYVVSIYAHEAKMHANGLLKPVWLHPTSQNPNYLHEAKMHANGLLKQESDVGKVYWCGKEGYEKRTGLHRVLSDPTDLVYSYVV